MMNIYPLKAATYCLVCGALIVSGGCNDNIASNPGELLITPANAKNTVATAVSSASVPLSEVPVGTEVAQAPSALDIVKLTEDVAMNRSGMTTLSTPAGITEDSPCDNGIGSFSNTYDTPTPTSRTGSISFTGCNLAGDNLNGELTYDLEWTDPSGPYTYHVTGNVTANSNNNMTAIGNLDYMVTGDTDTGDYSVDPFNHSVDYSGGHGFAVSLLEPVTGNVNPDNECPLTGTVLVTGANGTQAKATIDYPNINIEVDDGSGTFTPVDTVACTDIFPNPTPFLLRHI